MTDRILRALIVDDERLARRELIGMLSAFSGIQVVGEADNVATAVEAVTRLAPDVIFLDVQMPGETGFDLLDRVNVSSKVVFVTAYDSFALRAFEVNALDYLLKPVHPDRLKSTIERLLQNNVTESTDTHRLTYEDRLFLMMNTQWRFLRVNSVLCILAAGDYSEVITNDGAKWLTGKTMKEWEVRLPDRQFCRIHRSTIVNLEYVERVEDWFAHSFRIYLKGMADPLVLSRRYAARLKERLG